MCRYFIDPNITLSLNTLTRNIMKTIQLKKCCYCLPLHFGGIVCGMYVLFAAMVGFAFVIARDVDYHNKNVNAYETLFDSILKITVVLDVVLFFLGGVVLYGVYVESARILTWTNIFCFLGVIVSATLEVISLVTIGDYGIFAIKLAFYAVMLYFTIVLWSYCQELRRNQSSPKPEIHLIAMSRSTTSTLSKQRQRGKDQKNVINTSASSASRRENIRVGKQQHEAI